MYTEYIYIYNKKPLASYVQRGGFHPQLQSNPQEALS